MAKGGNKARSIRCPACSASVREDRIKTHLGTVHPGYRPDSAFKARLHETEVAVRKRARGTTGWRDFFTTWRIVAIVIVIVVAGVAVYAFTRPGPDYASVGKPAPEFTFSNVNGGSNALSAYQGHPVLILFFTTWCQYCQQATHIFVSDYYSQYRSANVTFLELEIYNNLGQSGVSLSTFASDYGYSGQAGWVMGWSDANTETLYDSQGQTDVYYLVSSHGVVLNTGSGLSGEFGAMLGQAQGN